MEPMLCERVVRRELKYLCGTNVMWEGGWEGAETLTWNQSYVEELLGRN